MTKNILVLFLGMIILYSCRPSNDFPVRSEVWTPIYGNKTDLTTIKSMPPQALTSAGKIYAYNNLVFQVDVQKGIHVYELVNKEPIKKQFIQVLGATEISIKNNQLYTNNYQDLVTISINDINNVVVTSRIENAFPIGAQLSTPPSPGYFQCVDTTKGTVIGWKLEKNIPANCKF